MKCSLGRILVAALAISFAGPAGAAELREWRAASGDVIMASLVDTSLGNVKLQTIQGRVIQVPRATLSQADQNYLVEYGGVAELPDGPAPNIAKAVRFNTAGMKKKEDKLALSELDLDFEIFETPHFFILERGSSRAKDTAEDAERLWAEMAFIHPDFARKWRKKKMAIFMVEDKEDYDALGKWYAAQVKALGDGTDPRFGIAARNIEISWPRTSAGTIRINRDIADENNLMRSARVFYVREEKEWRGNFVPFRVHCLAGDLLDIHVDGVSDFADKGWLAISTGHSFFREIELCGDVGTRLIGADSYEGDDVVEAGGFDDGSKWAKTLRDLIKDGKVTPKLADMFAIQEVAQLTPETCVLTYGLNQFMQSTVHRRAAYSRVLERVHTSSQVPVPEELAKIYGYDSVEKFEADWIAYMTSSTFK